jgi:hypothetical protein
MLKSLCVAITTSSLLFYSPCTCVTSLPTVLANTLCCSISQLPSAALALLQNYTPGTVVLAQQLLLALSPLHAHLLPRPETAFLCPSSFRPAVGKALMAEITSRPLLDKFQHEAAHLTMWHVHWHIGLRRYAAAEQQQQQQGLDTGSNGIDSSRSSSSSSRAWLAADDIDALYLDPDAR